LQNKVPFKYKERHIVRCEEMDREAVDGERKEGLRTVLADELRMHKRAFEKAGGALKNLVRFSPIGITAVASGLVSQIAALEIHEPVFSIVGGVLATFGAFEMTVYGLGKSEDYYPEYAGIGIIFSSLGVVAAAEGGSPIGTLVLTGFGLGLVGVDWLGQKS
jgi:hypothetical protein